MIPSNPICQVCDYGSSAVYRELPSEEQIRCGVIPLDSLPASWWNCMWNMTNSAVNQARSAVGVLIDEVNTVLQQAGVCVCDTCVDQLYQSINKISQIVGTAARAGAVKSSSVCGQVSIDNNGIMTANGLGNASQLTTTAHTAVGAINELKSTYDSCWSANVTALAGKAPTSHASSGTSYGVGSASNYGHLKISDTYTSVLTTCSGVAASQKAVACVYKYASDVASAALGLGDTAGCALGTAAAGTATTAARSDHVHPFPAITSLSGTLAIAHGGTGATTAANARTCLGLGTAATCAATAFLAATGCACDSAKFAGCTYACAKANILAGNAATATNATCFGGCTYAQAKANILTGCAADSGKFAGCTYAQAKADIRNYTPTNATNAENSTCFGGNTYAEARADILSGNAASATNATCFNGCTYACAKADILTGCAADSAKFAGCTYACAKANILSGNAATATNATCFGGCTYAQAKANILTGCAADSAKFAGCTYAQAKANILTGCAADSAKFAGCTYACAKADIRNYTPTNATNATNATNSTCFGGCTYAQAKADILTGNAATATNTTCFGGCTYAQAKNDMRDGLAPTSHASSATTYGIGTTANYGHLKICDTYTACCADAAAGVAASQKAVYNAYNNGRNFGNTASYAKYVCNATGEAGAADCTIVLGYARSHRWSSCPTNVCSYDRRTYSKLGTYQCQNKCAGFAYLDICNWQCCYSGTEGVTTCTNRRFCFQSDGYFVPPVGLWTTRICGRNATFGCQLIADRYAASGSATVTFARCGTILGHIGTDTVGGALKRFTANGSASYTILDTSAAVTIAQGGTGATTAADARTNLGLGSAAVCAATAFLGASACAADSAKLGGTAAACYLLKTGCAADSAKLTGKAPSALCVACAGANGSGTAFGTAATVNTGTAAGCVPLVGTALGTTANKIVLTDANGKLKPSGSAVGSAAYCAATAFLGASACAADSAKLAGKTPANLCVGCAGEADHAGYALAVNNTPTQGEASKVCDVYFYTGCASAGGVIFSYASCICGCNGYYYGNICGGLHGNVAGCYVQMDHVWTGDVEATQQIRLRSIDPQLIPALSLDCYFAGCEYSICCIVGMIPEKYTGPSICGTDAVAYDATVTLCNSCFAGHVIKVGEYAPEYCRAVKHWKNHTSTIFSADSGIYAYYTSSRYCTAGYICNKTSRPLVAWTHCYNYQDSEATCCIRIPVNARCAVPVPPSLNTCIVTVEILLPESTFEAWMVSDAGPLHATYAGGY